MLHLNTKYRYAGDLSYEDKKQIFNEKDSLFEMFSDKKTPIPFL